ncbi:SNW/SKI-interacting protein A-like [Triticum dicoccoides]|uniref:SNW/SKI-interacting protein A-like n=1 Tax=Triticum dicoccoides TaxID=85692 RepID=UPI0018913064|nr:SNW/SKI-interacting protein A-like [Triticum dicoccoides]
MESASKIASSRPGDDVPMISDDDDYEVDYEAVTARTKAALEKALFARLATERPGADIQPHKRVRPAFIRYVPAPESTASNSGAAERIIRLSEISTDPLDPPMIKFRRLPRPSRPPPVPVRSSPPRAPSQRDQADWKIPPCVSDWKNPKGYSIPLDKRQLATSDGRGTRGDQIASNFAMLAEALYVAEKKAREAVLMRKKMQQELQMKEKERREKQLRRLAKVARATNRADAESSPAAPVREEPRGLQPKAKQGGSDMHGNADRQRLAKTGRSKPDKGLSGGAPKIRAGVKRERPVGHDEPEKGGDPFGLDQFMSQFACLGMDDFNLDELLGSMLHIS